MTLAKFDPRNITQYIEPRFLLHFQWGKSEKVYRYALVEIINQGAINHKTKQKDDEKSLTQKEIWENKYTNKGGDYG